MWTDDAVEQDVCPDSGDTTWKRQDMREPQCDAGYSTGLVGRKGIGGCKAADS